MENETEKSLEEKLDLLKGKNVTLNLYFGEKRISHLSGKFDYKISSDLYALCFDDSFVILSEEEIRYISLSMLHIAALLS